MEFWGKVLEIIGTKMEVPKPFGWFHLLFIALTAGFTVLLCLLHKNDDHDRVRKTVFAVAIVVLVLEIYKQIFFNFSFDGEKVVFAYQWYIFPFQFCSMPLYIGLLAGIIKRGRLHDALCSFLATYAIFAGLCVMVYPSDVFCATMGINIQTMICHGSMISVGIYLLYSGHVKLRHKTILGAMAVFAVCAAIATAMNEVAYAAGLDASVGFNMFYFSRHCPGTLPIFSSVQKVVPFAVSFVIYILVFSLVAYIILLAAMGVSKLCGLIKKKV